eukprot:GDKI01042187.1.p1 GENE.GDKI01042187.1~~GDKI01042187.1.p1  ORF type:complete len:343 (+),score=78.11 GDKI01042187.1:56-1084(+)
MFGAKADVVAAMLFYMVVSLAIVFLNYAIFTSVVRLPVFVSWFQMVVSLICSILMGHLGTMIPSLSFFPQYEFKWDIAVQVLPLTLSYVGNIAFNNVCLQLVQVSTYQVARSSTIFWNICLSYFILNMRTSTQAFLACMMVVSGLVVGALDPSTLSFFGVVTGTIGSVFWALYSVNTKKYMKVVDDNQFLLLMYNITWSIVLFIPAIWMAGEWPKLNQVPTDLTQWVTVKVWIAMVVSGVFGFLMSIAVFVCIKLTNPVTFNIVGTVKACVQSVGGIVFLGDTVSIQSLMGIMLCVGGSYWYAAAKQAEGKGNTASAKPQVQYQKVEQDVEMTAGGSKHETA